jgi:hypothetical protein
LFEEGGLAEVELGKMAAQKGSTHEVREFGVRMQKDHGKANEADSPSFINRRSAATDVNFTLKWVHDIYARRRPEGSEIMFSVSFMLWPG